MHLAKEIGRQKSNSSDKKEGSFSDSFNKDGTHYIFIFNFATLVYFNNMVLINYQSFKQV